jgi:hypothetical protein
LHLSNILGENIMFNIEIEFKNKQKLLSTASSYIVGSSVFVLEHEKEVDLEYFNIDTIFKITVKKI